MITRLRVEFDERNYEVTYVDELRNMKWEICFSVGGMTAYGDLPEKAHSALYNARSNARAATKRSKGKPGIAYFCDY